MQFVLCKKKTGDAAHTIFYKTSVEHNDGVQFATQAALFPWSTAIPWEWFSTSGSTAQLNIIIIL